MEQQTPEPWDIQNRGNLHGDSGRVVVVDRHQMAIARMVDLSEVSYADARRIIACVNGCAGINPEAVPELLEALRKLWEFKVQYHRDETAEELLDALTTQFEGLQETARAAIAKAEVTP